MSGVARNEFGRALRIGGTENHLHGLLSLSTAVSAAEAMRKWKSLSSGWVHKTFPSASDFGWQAGYGVFSVSQSNAAAVIEYIENQREHHRTRTFEEEFVALLLVAPDGTSYAAAHWVPDAAPQRILDVRPDGKRAFLRFEGSLGLLDLTTGSMLPLPVPAASRHVTFSRPTGRDYVALSPTGVIEMYGENGALLRTLGGYQGEIYDFGIPLRPWLYGPSGLDLVINAPAGPTLVGNRGEHIRDLDRPGTDCQAMSWWTETEVLVRCLNPRPGWPDAFTLWIVDAGGQAASRPLATADHADPGAGHDGFVDGIRAGNTALIQGFLMVGSGWYPTYRAEPPSNPIPLGDPIAGQLVAATSTTFMVWQLGCCGVIWGGLSIYALDGTEVALLDAPEGVFGVTDANGVGGH